MPDTILFDQFSDMDESALLFWERLQECLTQHNLKPVLIHYYKAARPTKIPLIWSLVDAMEFYPKETLGEDYSTVTQKDIDFVFQSASNWGQQMPSEEHAHRIANECKNFATAVLDRYQPALLVSWNGYHLEQSFLRRAAIERGVPVVFMERSPFSGWLVLDDAGILADSSFGQLQLDDLDPVTESSQRVATDFLEMVVSSPTWHQQPESIGSIHQKLKIPQGRKLLTFFGQVDYDTQNFLFNPHFTNNAKAWEWFLEITTQLGDGFHRLGKHHPKSSIPESAYAQSPLDRSDWRADLPIEAVVKQSQALASVNSSAMTDSMIARKPVMFLGGGSYYSGKQLAYEIHPQMSEEAIREELHAWLYDSRSCTHRSNLLRCVNHMLTHHMIAIHGEQRNEFGLSIEYAAQWFANHAVERKKQTHIIYSTQAASAYLNVYSSRTELLKTFYDAQQDCEVLRLNLKDKNKDIKRKDDQIKKQKKEISRLQSDIRSAEKWQRSWVKRVFHRWRPKSR